MGRYGQRRSLSGSFINVNHVLLGGYVQRWYPAVFAGREVDHKNPAGSIQPASRAGVYAALTPS